MPSLESYVGSSDGTFELTKNLRFECIICGQEYTINRNSLNITVTDHPLFRAESAREHYFWGVCRCRECGERLFYRVKVYEYPERTIHHIISECDDVDFLEEPQIRCVDRHKAALYQPQIAYPAHSAEDLFLQPTCLDIFSGTGTIYSSSYDINEFLVVNGTTRVRLPVFGNKLVQILVQDTGTILYEDSKLVFKEVILPGRLHQLTMNLLGNVAEAVIVRNCQRDRKTNEKWIKIASRGKMQQFFDQYRAFGTASLRTKDQFPSKYDPDDTQRDIIWLDQNGRNMVDFMPPASGDDIGLQVKTSDGNRSYIYKSLMNGFYESPLAYFPLDHDYDVILERLQKNTDSNKDWTSDFINVEEVDPESFDEVKAYYPLIYGLYDGRYKPEDLLAYSDVEPSLQSGIVATVFQIPNRDIQLIR